MPPAILSLVLALISSAWGLWGASSHPVVTLDYNAQVTNAYAYTWYPTPGTCQIVFTGAFVSTAPLVHPGGKSVTDWEETIVNHEVGHCLGLNHSPNPADLMYAEPSATVPTAEDLATYQAANRFAPAWLMQNRVTVAGF